MTKCSQVDMDANGLTMSTINQVFEFYCDYMPYEVLNDHEDFEAFKENLKIENVNDIIYNLVELLKDNYNNE